uniref:Uncharacterized protein n=1 Tax=Cacopsylla melanoneura TaxID=428564 RepID=A0A8D8RXV8_9HEMI
MRKLRGGEEEKDMRKLRGGGGGMRKEEFPVNYLFKTTSVSDFDLGGTHTGRDLDKLPTIPGAPNLFIRKIYSFSHNTEWTPLDPLTVTSCHHRVLNLSPQHAIKSK